MNVFQCFWHLYTVIFPADGCESVRLYEDISVCLGFLWSKQTTKWQELADRWRVWLFCSHGSLKTDFQKQQLANEIQTSVVRCTRIFPQIHKSTRIWFSTAEPAWAHLNVNPSGQLEYENQSFLVAETVWHFGKLADLLSRWELEGEIDAKRVCLTLPGVLTKNRGKVNAPGQETVQHTRNG